ncbi:MAG: HAD-IIIC family phosphatase [Methylophilus sp.]|nr:HAD-IIIC family phosphatase [Methylophilus sp.]
MYKYVKDMIRWASAPSVIDHQQSSKHTAEQASQHSTSADLSALATTLKQHRQQVAEIYANALVHSPRWVPTLEKGKSNWLEFLQLEFFAMADYLAMYFERADATFKQLLLGEKIKSLYDADANEQARVEICKLVFAEELKAFEQSIKPLVTEIQWNLLVGELESIQHVLDATPAHKKRILLVGDCLFLDVIPFVAPALLNEDIAIQTDYVTSKNPFERSEQLRKLSAEKFDLIFISPFTYDFSVELSKISDWKQTLHNFWKRTPLIQNAWLEAESTIKLVADLYDCPVYVHNASFVNRDDQPRRLFIRNLLTYLHRQYARTELNQKLSGLLNEINQASYTHLFLFDETTIVKQVGEMQAGAFLYRSYLQHPAALGKFFAEAYTDIIYVNTYLTKKKLVISDLDNTLWNGVIGEGAVEHYHDRQLKLKQLKSKGVVLAINSKNDPVNVHWRGATLSDDDFVYAAISWAPKVQAIKAIEQDLNLKLKSFVFIDDRKDELELMLQTYPDILCLDATQPTTWKRIQYWHDALEVDMEMDRTLMYKQREERKAFVKEDVSSEEEKIALFTSLNLRLIIKRPEVSELKRVTELINRTNQFNLEGFRTTYKEVLDWYESPDYLILTGQTADRFGDMGVTCIAVTKQTGDQVEFVAFVLSCRVFGYQFEYAMMNHIMRVVKARQATTLVGRYVATPQNMPCKDFFKNANFVETGGQWVFDLAKPLQADASWIHVEVESS